MSTDLYREIDRLFGPGFVQYTLEEFQERVTCSMREVFPGFGSASIIPCKFTVASFAYGMVLEDSVIESLPNNIEVDGMLSHPDYKHQVIGVIKNSLLNLGCYLWYNRNAFNDEAVERLEPIFRKNGLIGLVIHPLIVFGTPKSNAQEVKKYEQAQIHARYKL